MLSLIPDIYSDTISLNPENLSAVSLSVVSIEGLISLSNGIIWCLILFLVYLVSAFDLSSRNSMLCWSRNSVISRLVAKSNGLMIMLFTGFIPAIPAKPVPLARLISRVSILSVSYTHLRAHETVLDLVCRLL